MTYINFSEQESSYTKLRIGRTETLSTFNIDDFVKEIFELKLDICRLKVDISNPNIFTILDSIKFPMNMHSFLIDQKLNLNNIESELEIDKDLTIVDYDMSKKDELLHLIKIIQESDSFNIYYENEILEKILPNNILNDVIANFQTTFDNNINKDKHCFLAYKNNKLIGFCSLQIHKKFGEAILVGIIPEYRSKDLMQNFVKIQINKTKSLACESYHVKTIAFNSRSLNTTLKQGMNINQTILNINIMPLLNYKASEEIKIDVNKTNVLTSIESYIQNRHTNSKYIKEVKLNTSKNELDTITLKLFDNLNTGIFFNDSNNFYGFIKLE